MVRLRWSRSTPLRSRRPVDGGWLVGLWVDILRQRRAVLVRHAAGGPAVLKQLQTGFNVDVCRVKIRRPLVGVQSVGGLIVARLILATISKLVIHNHVIAMDSPRCQGHTRPQKYSGSGEWPGSTHPAHRGTGLFDSTRLRWSTRRSGSSRHGRRLAGRPHMPLGISVVPCNSDPEGTNFERRFGLWGR
jgi:hypothetical protein